MKNLRDNEDGTCNCRPLGNGCFFTNRFGGICSCKCHLHTTKDMEWKDEFERIYSHFDLNSEAVFRGKLYKAKDLMKDFISQAVQKAREEVVRDILALERTGDYSEDIGAYDIKAYAKSHNLNIQ